MHMPSMPSYPPYWEEKRIARDETNAQVSPGSLFWAVVFLLTVSGLVLYMLLQLHPGFPHMR
ncbi:MAG: hypothetical protein ACXWUG_13590 [Polyangiales bacterium]